MDDSISSAINSLQAFYTIVLALSVGEAFKQVIPESHRQIENQKRDWGRLSGLLGLVSFLALVLPFFQGMSRYLYVEYKQGPLADSYATYLMLDCIAFTIESALFFVLSRRLAAQEWRQFYTVVLWLLVVDGVWGVLAWMRPCRDTHTICIWLVLDAIFFGVFVLILLLSRIPLPSRVPPFFHHKGYLIGAAIGMLAMVARTGLDYWRMWPFYFPPVQKHSAELGKQNVSMVENKASIYLAGPLFTQAEWQWNAALAAKLRGSGYEVVLPQDRAEPMLRGDEAFDGRVLFSGNLADIERVDVVVAVLDGADADSGTCWESGYAYKAGRPVIGLRTDLRAGGDDPKTAVNLMLSQSCSAFVTVPPGKRDDSSWVSERIIEAIRATSRYGP
jgi:nucleoside 2-deoxyribosyltransferase